MAASVETLVIRYIVWGLYLVGLYFTLFWFSVLLTNPKPAPKKKPKTWPEVTIILPIFNEERFIEWTLDSVFSLDYPKNKLNVICVNDGSTDGSAKVLEELQKKYDFKILTKENGGKFSAMNLGLEQTHTEYFCCLDADSAVEKDALQLMIMEFEDEMPVAAVCPVMKIYKPGTLIQRVQWLEYMQNIFYKWVMAKLDCIFVAPGPLSTYKTAIIKEIGGFKRAHLTEDLEIAMRLQDKQYKIKQSLDATVYTKGPHTFPLFFKQRIRWYQGTILNMIDYRHMMFNRKYGDLGVFILPLVVLSGLLSLSGLVVVAYVAIREFIINMQTWYLTHFDFLTYLRNWEWTFSLIDAQWQMIFANGILLSLIVTVIYFSFRFLQERISQLKEGPHVFMLLFYFLVYFLALGLVWGKVFTNIAFGVKNKWVKAN